MAPEIIRSRGDEKLLYNPQRVTVDTWALENVVYRMITAKLPYGDHLAKKYEEKVSQFNPMLLRHSEDAISGQMKLPE